MALPLLTWAEKQWPGSFKYWHIARKCAQAAPLYYNHPLINELVISDCNEGIGPRDIEIARSCHIVVNTMPQHPEADGLWFARRDIYHETALMAGLSDSDYNSLSSEEKRPKLVQWFETERKKRSIAIWPCAGYGLQPDRYPTRKWTLALVKRLILEGYTIYQCGHPKDYEETGGALEDCIDVRQLSFFEQIRFTLGCDLMIGTDSGSSLVVGAYQSIPQISLLVNRPGQGSNINAFATNSPLNFSFIGQTAADDISQQEVCLKVTETTKS